MSNKPTVPAIRLKLTDEQRALLQPMYNEMRASIGEQPMMSVGQLDFHLYPTDSFESAYFVFLPFEQSQPLIGALSALRPDFIIDETEERSAW